MERGTAAGRRGGGAGTWPVQDAKARFSALLRAARESGPQRVTLHGRDAVVVVAAEEYDRLAASAAVRPGLHAFLSASPLRELDFGGELGERAPVRDVDL